MEPPAANKPKYHAEEYRGKFLALFPELVAELTDEGLANPQVVDAMQHLKKVTYVHVSAIVAMKNVLRCFYSLTHADIYSQMLEYNIPGGEWIKTERLNMVQTVVHAAALRMYILLVICKCCVIVRGECKGCQRACGKYMLAC